jgi:hypothetical protein
MPSPRACGGSHQASANAAARKPTATGREFLVRMALMDTELSALEPPELAAEAARVAARLAAVAAA